MRGQAFALNALGLVAIRRGVPTRALEVAGEAVVLARAAEDPILQVRIANLLGVVLNDIGRLPEDQRAALVMSELEELGHAEVAEVLGCPRDKVRALVYQARSSLSGWREARALPCREVRQELAVARAGALRRGHLRRHLKLCPECATFREDLDRQRRGLALVLPVLPGIGLKERVLEAVWGAAGAGGGAAAGRQPRLLRRGLVRAGVTHPGDAAGAPGDWRAPRHSHRYLRPYWRRWACPATAITSS